ncbi:MAG: hypothetical protein LC624_10745 [Halobacteriales archaeon]|nr:hypothetical protein [Halobacteriales archaeon]
MSERKPSQMQAWSPYGLEAYRVQLLRRRSRLVYVALAVGLVIMAAMLLNSIHTGTDITVHNGDGSSITVKIPETPRPKPTTLTISPGKTTVLQQPIQPESRPTPNPPSADNGPAGLNWAAVLSSLVPPFALVLGAARYAKKRAAGPLEQVNLGIFKGPLPLEMITATHRTAVYTPRMAYASIFGKQRDEYIPTVTTAGYLGGPSLSERYREALARETQALRHALDGKFAALARYRQRRADIARQKGLLAAQKEAIKQEYKRKLAAIDVEMQRLHEEQARAEAEAKAAAGEFHDAGELE